MRILPAATLVLVTILSLASPVRAGEKAVVETAKANADADAAKIDLRIEVTPDHAFVVGNRKFDGKQLEAALAQTQKTRGIGSVLVTGDRLVVDDLVEIARMGKRIGFTTLFKINGQIKTVNIAQ